MKIFILHPVQYLAGSFLAVLKVFSEHQNIIHVDDQPSFSDHVSESGVHECLEGRQRVASPEEHDQGFIEAVGGGERCFPLVSLPNVNVVVPPSDVHLREVLSSFQFINEGGDEGQWVCILDRVFIEISIILAGVESSIFLLDEEEQGSLGGSRFPDLARFEMFINEGFTCLHLLWVHGVGLGYFWNKGLF